MYTAIEVDAILAELKQQAVSRPDIIRRLSESCLGWPYVFGASGELCTPSVRRKYASYRPDHAAAITSACPVLSGKQATCAGCKWDGCRCFDCRGFTRWLLAQVNLNLYGGTVTAQWETSSNWAIKGDIKDMPHGLICCVFREGHTGMYVGNELTRHCGGKKGQVVEEPLPGSPKWLRYAIPSGLYTTDELREAGLDVDESKNIPTLRNGSRGDEVEELQALLNAKYGFNLDVDGIFGAKTEAAVKAFQRAHGLTADGVVGPKTRKALGLEYTDTTDTPPWTPEEPQEPDEPEKDDEDTADGVWIAMDDWRTIKAAFATAEHVIKKYEQED